MREHPHVIDYLNASLRSMEFNAMFDMMMGGVWNSNSVDYGYIYSV
jgi:hypothetical protein